MLKLIFKISIRFRNLVSFFFILLLISTSFIKIFPFLDKNSQKNLSQQSYSSFHENALAKTYDNYSQIKDKFLQNNFQHDLKSSNNKFKSLSKEEQLPILSKEEMIQLINNIFEALNGKTLRFQYNDLLNNSDVFFHDKKFKNFLSDQIFTYLKSKKLNNFNREYFQVIFILMFDIRVDISQKKKIYAISFEIFNFQYELTSKISSIVELTSVFDQFQVIKDFAIYYKGLGKSRKINFNLSEESYHHYGFQSFLDYLEKKAKKAFKSTLSEKLRSELYQEKTVLLLQQFFDQNFFLGIRFNQKEVDKNNQDHIKIKESIESLQENYFLGLKNINNNGFTNSFGLYYHDEVFSHDSKHFDENGNILDQLVTEMTLNLSALHWSEDTLSKLKLMNLNFSWFSWSFTFNHFNHIPLHFIFWILFLLGFRLFLLRVISPFTKKTLISTIEGYLLGMAVGMSELTFNPVLREVDFVNEWVGFICYQEVANFVKLLLSTPVIGQIILGIITYLSAVIISNLMMLASAYIIIMRSSHWKELEAGKKETITIQARHFGLVSYKITHLYVDQELIY